MNYISDFHTHIALKAANNETIKNIWATRQNPPPKKFLFFFNVLRQLALDPFYNEYATSTQCNLDKCVKGNVRLVFCSIYPIERPYIARKNTFTWLLSSFSFFTKKFPFLQFFNKKKNLLLMMIQVLVGVSEKRALEFWNEQKKSTTQIDYFQDYLKELNVLTVASGQEPQDENHKAKQFKLVKNYEEFQAHITNPDVICGILSLEGIHGLGTYKVEHLFSDKNIDVLSISEGEKLYRSLFNNITRIKQDDNMAPFYITVAHHFNNLVCGHSKSFNGALKLFFKQKGGVNTGLTVKGQQLLKLLLHKDQNQRRILIDIKHMSVKSRLQFYDIVEKAKQDNDFIPIISSHSAVSGVKKYTNFETLGSGNKADKNAYVSRGDINLCDQDIVAIYKSGGLIGVLMHDGRMPGCVYKKTFKNTLNVADRMLLQQQLFLTNVYHIINVVDINYNESAWDIVSLGSDMDGMINPFDDYDGADKLMAFRNHIYQYLENYDTLDDRFKIKNLYENAEGKIILSTERFLKLNAGLSVKEITDNIFYKNTEVFLSRYFTQNYLYGNH
ncbi:MAG: hypothetical protein ACK5NB_04705 [Flavobacteriaceae bacterium]